MATKPNNPAQAIPQIVDLLESFSDEDQSRIIQGVTHFLGATVSPHGRTGEHSVSGAPVGNGREPVFSGHTELNPKEFILNKDPQTDVERVACLAYYLTHYRDLRYFKTIDISNLNTEAAQRKLSNAAVTVKNASAQGYLTSAPQKKHKQISAVGEQYVYVLPDRQSAKEVMKNARPSRARKKKKAVTRKAQMG